MADIHTVASLLLGDELTDERHSRQSTVADQGLQKKRNNGICLSFLKGEGAICAFLYEFQVKRVESSPEL